MRLPQNATGVDIAKDWLDLHDTSTGRTWRIDNTAEALSHLMPELTGTFVVFEATGPYSHALETSLAGAAIVHARVNPRHAREFARASGVLAKTDRVDARLLARMALALPLVPARPCPPGRRRLAALSARRDGLTGMLVQEKNRLSATHDKHIRHDIEVSIRFLVRRRDQIDTRIETCKQEDPDLSRLDQRLQGVHGIGPVVATILIASLPELGQVDRRAIASLAGLAPHACESGYSKGTRRVWGGRANVRRAMYQAALSACRGKGPMAAKYRDLKAAGKPSKVAIIAIARKLLVILNAMVKDNQPFNDQA